MRAISAFLLGTSILLWAPATASAQGYLTGFVGGNFGGEMACSIQRQAHDQRQFALKSCHQRAR